MMLFGHSQQELLKQVIGSKGCGGWRRGRSDGFKGVELGMGRAGFMSSDVLLLVVIDCVLVIYYLHVGACFCVRVCDNM